MDSFYWELIFFFPISFILGLMIFGLSKLWKALVRYLNEPDLPNPKHVAEKQRRLGIDVERNIIHERDGYRVVDRRKLVQEETDPFRMTDQELREAGVTQAAIDYLNGVVPRRASHDPWQKLLERVGRS
jgi:hypothetical protein